jgi:hypothetical protein
MQPNRAPDLQRVDPSRPHCGLLGFLLLGILAYRTYTDEPPISSKTVGSSGEGRSVEDSLTEQNQ